MDSLHYTIQIPFLSRRMLNQPSLNHTITINSPLPPSPLPGVHSVTFPEAQRLGQ